MKDIVWAANHLRNSIDKKDVELYHRTMVIPGLSMSCWHVDRTASIDLPFKTLLKDINKFPDLNKPVKSLEKCLEDTADKILESNKHIRLMWSGGIDSTLMVLAFFLKKSNDNDITVVLNQDSIRENPNFYKKIIKNTFNVISTEECVRSLRYRELEGVTLQAEHADLLTFNENPFDRRIKKYTDEDILNFSNNLENTQILLSYLNMDSDDARCFYDLMTVTSKAVGINLTKLKHLFWWYNFNFRWQNNREKFRSRINPENFYETFYSSEDFQLWSIRNLENDLDLKTEFKKIIAKNFDDVEYTNHKIKWSSMSKHFATNSAFAVTYDDKLLSKNQINTADFYQSNNFFSNWLSSENKDK